ncbi:MAG: hypothetical protein IT223_07830 [Crocinitomicaceae bacterium]|nr:hypothetical protein [Crocinitomicaceae bacterium]
MKIIKLLAIVAIITGAVFFSGCTKESVSPIYNLRFTCTSNNPYLVEVNGKSNVLSGNTYKDYRLEKGTYSWKVTQQSGFVLYPTIQSGTVNLDQDKQIVFP